ncbi:MAG: hypothetical protein V4723_16630 [Pseudomonadota bacterium]
MKILCVTGAPGSDLDMVAGILAHAGVQPALPSLQDESITMQTWHDHVLSASFDEAPANKPVDEIGKFWEQIASSIFVANLKASNWSWANSRSVWLMDYWRKFDPNIRFVLVYTPPKRALAAALAARQVSGDSLTQLLETWVTYNREILRFHKRYPSKTLLVNADDCAANPSALIKECSERWKLKLSAEGIEAHSSFSPEPLPTYLAEQSLVFQPEFKMLKDEIESAVHPIASQDDGDLPSFTIFDALKDYNFLRDMAAQARSLSEDQPLLESKIRNLEFALTARTTSATATQEDLSACKKQLDEVRKENEQILLQMHQQQEELERVFIERKKLNEDLAAKEIALTELRKNSAIPEEQTAQAKVIANQLQVALQKCRQLEENNQLQNDRVFQLQNALDVASKDLAARNIALDKSSRELAAKNNELSAQTRTAQQLREAAAIAAQKAAERESANAALKKEVEATQQLKAAAATAAANAAERDALNARTLAALKNEVATAQQRMQAATVAAQNAAERELANAKAFATLKKEVETAQQQREAARIAAQNAAERESANSKALAALKNEVETAQQTAKKARQEGDLILVQLHQVQEELENYFLQNKAAAQRNKELEARWQRMLERNPDYCDYAALEAAPAQDNDARLDWKFTELNAAGRSFPELRFSTVIEDGRMRIALASNGDSQIARAVPLTALTTTEWSLIEILCKVLVSLLKPADLTTEKLFGLNEEQLDVLREGVQQLMDEMANFPPALRFDKVTLKREQVNPDYEHLWFAVENMSFGSKRTTEFGFRLSCANVRPGKFGLYPKLEFPAEYGTLIFEKWFVESYDDFGEKLELRFALPNSMDMAVFSELSANDQAFILGLINNLTNMLNQLESNGVHISRQWSDWHMIAGEIERIHSQIKATVDSQKALVAQEPEDAIIPKKMARQQKPSGGGRAVKARRGTS